MRMKEFLNLDREGLAKSADDVLNQLKAEVESAGSDIVGTAESGTPTGVLTEIMQGIYAERALKYGHDIGLNCAIMHSFRIGAAYGRRLPDGVIPLVREDITDGVDAVAKCVVEIARLQSEIRKAIDILKLSETTGTVSVGQARDLLKAAIRKQKKGE